MDLRRREVLFKNPKEKVLEHIPLEDKLDHSLDFQKIERFTKGKTVCKKFFLYLQSRLIF